MITKHSSISVHIDDDNEMLDASAYSVLDSIGIPDEWVGGCQQTNEDVVMISKQTAYFNLGKEVYRVRLVIEESGVVDVHCLANVGMLVQTANKMYFYSVAVIRSRLMHSRVYDIPAELVGQRLTALSDVRDPDLVTII